MKVFKTINKFLKSTYLYIPLDLFISFKFVEFGLIVMGFYKASIITLYIDYFSVTVSFVFSIFVIVNKIIQRILKTDVSFKEWLLFKK